MIEAAPFRAISMPASGRLARCTESGQVAHRRDGRPRSLRTRGLQAVSHAGSGWDRSRRWSRTWCDSLPARSGAGACPAGLGSRPPASVRSPRSSRYRMPQGSEATVSEPFSILAGFGLAVTSPPHHYRIGGGAGRTSGSGGAMVTAASVQRIPSGASRPRPGRSSHHHTYAESDETASYNGRDAWGPRCRRPTA